MRAPNTAPGEVYKRFYATQQVELSGAHDGVVGLCALSHAWGQLPAPQQIEPAKWEGLGWANMAEFVMAQDMLHVMTGKDFLFDSALYSQ